MTEHTKRFGHFEVRCDEDGSLDELLVYVGDRVVFHLEDMGADDWWASLTPNDKECWHLHFESPHLVVEDQNGDGGVYKGKNRDGDTL